jgi:hypothetical protein
MAAAVKVGDLVVQIPIEWPTREGRVVDVRDNSVQVKWDDERVSWYHEDDLTLENIWLVKP